MSLNILDLLGKPQRTTGRSPRYIVNVPITVRFLPDTCRWSLSDGKLVHVTDSPDGPIPMSLGERKAWEVREEFFDMKTEADLMTFLGRTGVFFGPSESGCWTVADCFRCKDAILRLLKTKPDKWRLRMFPYEAVVEMLAVRSKPRVEFAWTGGQHPEHAAYSGRCRSAFRGDGDRDSELMPITIPR
jgi:hypothetical protein